MKILHIDTNHSLLLNQLNDIGFQNDEDYTSSKEEIIDSFGYKTGKTTNSWINKTHFVTFKAILYHFRRCWTI